LAGPQGAGVWAATAMQGNKPKIRQQQNHKTKAHTHTLIETDRDTHVTGKRGNFNYGHNGGGITWFISMPTASSASGIGQSKSSSYGSITASTLLVMDASQLLAFGTRDATFAS